MKAIPVTIETQKEYKVSMGEAITTRPANLEELDVTENGTYVAPEDGGYTPVVVNVTPSLQSKTATPTESAQTIAPDTGYDGLSSVSVGAVSSTYVGSDIPRNSSSDLTTSGPTITVPAGYYENNATKSVNTATLPSEAISSPEYGYNFKAFITPSDNAQFIDIPAGYNPENVFYEFGKMWRGSKTITENGTYLSDDDGWDGYLSVTVSVPGQIINNQNKSVNPTESTQTVTADSGYTGLGTVSVGAISSTYVGSGISRKSSTDLTSSGATVTAPAGYYASNATKTVASGTATAPTSISGTAATVSTGTNTLTLTKTVSVTPRITTAGYISSGTAGNASVSLQANVTTKAAATITPGTSNQTIASGTYLTGTQTISGDANLVAGNIKNGTTIFGVTGTYEGGGGGTGKNAQISQTVGRATSSTYTAVGPSITVSKAGTYHVYWSGYRSSTSGTSGSQLYINGVAYGSARTSFNTGSGLTNTQSIHLTNVSLSANDVLTIRARSRGNNYYMYIQDLVIIEA